MSKHIKEVEFKKAGITYALEIDIEDSDNYVLESVTIVDGPGAVELDLDPEDFDDTLDDDDWKRIDEILGGSE